MSLKSYGESSNTSSLLHHSYQHRRYSSSSHFIAPLQRKTPLERLINPQCFPVLPSHSLEPIAVTPSAWLAVSLATLTLFLTWDFSNIGQRVTILEHIFSQTTQKSYFSAFLFPYPVSLASFDHFNVREFPSLVYRPSHLPNSFHLTKCFQ